MNIFPVLKTERLLLRQFTKADLEMVFKGLSDPDIIKYYGVQYHTLEAAKEQLKFFADLENNGDGIWWAICSSDGALFYGAAGLNNLNKKFNKCEIGFWLFPEFWGRGIITEAVPAICNFGFVDLGLHRIEALVESENLNSKKALNKLHFTFEGTMRDCEIKAGRYISIDIYAKLNPDP